VKNSFVKNSKNAKNISIFTTEFSIKDNIIKRLGSFILVQIS